MIISISVRCENLGEHPADQVRAGVDVAKAALNELSENADIFSRPRAEQFRFFSTDVSLPGGQDACGRISVAPGPRVIWRGLVDDVRTRIVRPSPGDTHVETALGQDDRDDALVPDEDGEKWEACDDTHARHAYEACLLSLIGDLPAVET